MQFWFGGTCARKLRKKNLTKDHVQLVRHKRQAYVKQTKTFNWGYQRELEEQLARKRFKSKFKKKITMAATFCYFIVPRKIIKYFTINVFLF